MKLAIAQMVLGVLIVSDFAMLKLVGVGWIILYFHYYQIYIGLGLAVLGCGIAQFLKARKLGMLMSRHPEGTRAGKHMKKLMTVIGLVLVICLLVPVSCAAPPAPMPAQAPAPSQHPKIIDEGICAIPPEIIDECIYAIPPEITDEGRESG